MSECCGIDAFSFSPFNIIYHLTMGTACIRNEDVSEIRSEVAELLRNLGGADQHAEEFAIDEFNQVFTVEQLISLFDVIDAALSEGCAIYAAHEKQIGLASQRFSSIFETPK